MRGTGAGLCQGAAGGPMAQKRANSHGIHRRHIRFKGKDATGGYIDRSNNGDTFSIIE